MSARRLRAACLGIVAFGVLIVIVIAVWRELTTIVQRMREYYSLRRGYCTPSAVWRERTTIVCGMREYYCFWRGYCNDECCMA